MKRKPEINPTEKAAWHRKLTERKAIEAEIELLSFGATLDEINPELELEFKEIFG